MKSEVDHNFSRRVCDLVATIPHGKVMTYGDIAALCGQANAARIVGGIAHFGPPELPWHRVVNRLGGLASGFTGQVVDAWLDTEGAPGGREGHKMLLESENIPVEDFKIVDFAERRWLP